MSRGRKVRGGINNDLYYAYDDANDLVKAKNAQPKKPKRKKKTVHGKHIVYTR